MPFRVFIDTQILVRSRPRDVILALGECGTIDPLWSPLVLDELADPLPPGISEAQHADLVNAMNRAFPEASVNWPGLVDIQVELAVSAKDRHVAAAALYGRADVILTEDEQFLSEVRGSRLCDAQNLPELIAYAIDTDQPKARQALIEMAIRRWGASHDDAEQRLKAYFDKNGWNPGALDATRRPRSSYRW